MEKSGKGFMVLIGVSNDDTKRRADKMVKKNVRTSYFLKMNRGKTNLSLDAVGGELLLISQFTLYANCKRGKPAKLHRSRSTGYGLGNV